MTRSGLRVQDEGSPCRFRSRTHLVASRANELRTSDDAGRSFRYVGATDVLGADDEVGAFVQFRSRREGIVSTLAGTFHTVDGGRSFRALPRPQGPFARIARLTSAGLLTDGPLGTLLLRRRPYDGVRTSSVALKIAGAARAPRGRVRLRLTGRVHPRPAVAVPFSGLRVMTAKRPGARTVQPLEHEYGVGVRGDGRFSFEIDVLPGRAIRVRSPGAFDESPFVASSLSRWVRAPAQPRR